jgi:hypothetical protein
LVVCKASRCCHTVSEELVLQAEEHDVCLRCHDFASAVLRCGAAIFIVMELRRKRFVNVLAFLVKFTSPRSDLNVSEMQSTHWISWRLMARSTPNAISRISSRHLQRSCMARCVVIGRISPFLFHPSWSKLLTALVNSSGGRNNSSSVRSRGRPKKQNFLLSVTGTPFMDESILSVLYIEEISRLLNSDADVVLVVP